MLSHVNLLHTQMTISRILRMVCYAIFNLISCKCKVIKTHRKLNISHSKVFPNLEVAKDVNPECEQMLIYHPILSQHISSGFSISNVKCYQFHRCQCKILLHNPILAQDLPESFRFKFRFLNVNFGGDEGA